MGTFSADGVHDRGAPAGGSGGGAPVRTRDSASRGHVPVTDAEARAFRIGRATVLGGDPGDPDAELAVEHAVARLTDVLPCAVCGWMPRNCPCGRPELRAELFRVAPADVPSVLASPAEPAERAA